MAMNRASFAKMLEPGLNTLFGLEYDSYPAEYEAVFESNTSQKAFEEDVLLAGFGNAPTKSEGSAVSYDAASQQWTARYQHETVALAFSITEEAEEDGQYGSIASRYTKALARSMASTKEIKAANILNTATTVNGGDGAPLLSNAHPTQNGERGVWSWLKSQTWFVRRWLRANLSGAPRRGFGRHLRCGAPTPLVCRHAPLAARGAGACVFWLGAWPEPSPPAAPANHALLARRTLVARWAACAMVQTARRRARAATPAASGAQTRLAGLGRALV